MFATTGLYELIRGAGYRIRVADQTIGATNAPADIAALLHEKKGAALITMRRVAYDDEGWPSSSARTCTARPGTASRSPSSSAEL